MTRRIGSALMLLLFTAFAPVLAAQFTGLAPTESPGLNVRRPLTTDPAVLYPANREMVLMPGDLIRVSVYGVSPAYSDTERVSLSGTVRLDLLGSVSLQGLSLPAAERTLATKFEQAGMFHNAQVSIDVAEAPGHVATVIGEAHGTVPLPGPKRLYDVLAAVGGLPSTASTVLQIDRPGLPEPIVVDVGNNPATDSASDIPVFAGDTITVARVGSFYVVGAVNTPGAFPLSGAKAITVIKALSMAGGTNYAAQLDHARLVRTVGSERSVINVQLQEIKAGKLPDPVLQSEDILLVPSSAFREAFHSSNALNVIALALSLATVLR